MKARFICFNAQWDIGTKMVKEWKKWQTFYKYAYNKNLQNVKKKEKRYWQHSTIIHNYMYQYIK